MGMVEPVHAQDCRAQACLDSRRARQSVMDELKWTPDET
jgi:hypothetical protein